MSQGRSIDEILGNARSELQDREARLQDIVSRAKGELDDVRKALRKLGGGGKRRNGASPGGAPPQRSGPNTALREQIVSVLRASLDPITASEVARKVDEDTTPQAVATTLRHMEREGTVEKVEGKWGVPQALATGAEE